MSSEAPGYFTSPGLVTALTTCSSADTGYLVIVQAATYNYSISTTQCYRLSVMELGLSEVSVLLLAAALAVVCLLTRTRRSLTSLATMTGGSTAEGRRSRILQLVESVETEISRIRENGRQRAEERVKLDQECRERCRQLEEQYQKDVEELSDLPQSTNECLIG